MDFRHNCSRLNPLHCGAVVASTKSQLDDSVLIGSLNPLHCGAVVASNFARPLAARRGGQVSIPFIAGQWSLLIPPGRSPRRSLRLNPLHCGAVVASGVDLFCDGGASRLTPLHCGAVVASVIHPRVGGQRRGVSIPFIAGQWSLLRRASTCRRAHARVSIPFIAGQWSLLSLAWGTRVSTSCLNPLHCGAVVASKRAGRDLR